MTEITRDDNHAQVSETETESWTEQQMRSDFMHAEHYNRQAMEDYDPADVLDYREYADRWTTGEQQWADRWDYLSDATDRWSNDRARAERELEFRQSLGWLTSVEQRSEEQARYIADHGTERDEFGWLTSHYVTRVEDHAESETGTPSPLANYRPGNALAAHAANTERDGSER
ncbi:hypothetical protein [Nocardia nova]|uniref:hypothetical protein n=1 Tax=Nocardia nova TaxID=37330 RepID=UPI0033E34C23